MEKIIAYTLCKATEKVEIVYAISYRSSFNYLLLRVQSFPIQRFRVLIVDHDPRRIIIQEVLMPSHDT